MRTAVLGNRSVLALLVAETVSMTGSQMTWLALPWFVLATSGSATRMGLVVTAELVAVAVFGVPGGAVAQRIGARRTMLVTNASAGPLERATIDARALCFSAAMHEHARAFAVSAAVDGAAACARRTVPRGARRRRGWRD